MVRFTALACLVLPAMLLGGCATKADRYPSLAIRDTERVQGAFEPANPAPAPAMPSPAAPELLDRLPQILAEADSAHRAFEAAAPRAAGLVRSAAGTAVASSRWAQAQIALADLDSHRSNTAILLGDLDLLYADATLAFEEHEAIETARETVLSMISKEDAFLSELRESLTR